MGTASICSPPRLRLKSYCLADKRLARPSISSWHSAIATVLGTANPCCKQT
ncbi:unnamed protein product [Periconia digitata]|uniref:Uncharacterized protein n=1 Tax=Periconia digitata TaxID=1303443 RepID=A0A9W4U3J1_9PLEO|nr:unnamed protein product [Periconia digitata]